MTAVVSLEEAGVVRVKAGGGGNPVTDAAADAVALVSASTATSGAKHKAIRTPKSRSKECLNLMVKIVVGVDVC